MSEIDITHELLSKLDELIAKLNEYNLSFAQRQYIIRELLYRIVLYYCGIEDEIKRIIIYGKSSDGERYVITLEP